MHGLGDEVELAMRLLAPAQLEELLAGGEELRRKLVSSPNKDKLVRTLVSALDPEVDRLVTGLQACEQGGSAEQGEQGEDLIKEAKRRLAAQHSDARASQIADFASRYGLADEVQLAMRLLEPTKLEELLAGESDISVKFAEVTDPNELMMSLISMLDADVAKLVKGLRELEEGGGGAEEGDEGLVAEAQQRLAASKTATSVASIERFAKKYELGDEVQLAMRMLSPANLQEFLAGEADLAQKFAEVPDRNKLMMTLIAQLDPSVEKLVKRLQAMDEQAGGNEESAPEDLFAEAQKRLEDNKSPLSSTTIKKLTQDFGLSEETELALRLLKLPQLQELLSGGQDLKLGGQEKIRQKLERARDKNALIMTLVTYLDPSVDRLVRSLAQIDAASGATPTPPPAGPRQLVVPKRLTPKQPTQPPPARALGPKPPATRPPAAMTPTVKAAARPLAARTAKPPATPPPASVAPTKTKAAPATKRDAEEDDGWGGWQGEEKRRKVECPPAPAKADSEAPVSRKKLKCMVCKGDHRAADCPKMK